VNPGFRAWECIALETYEAGLVSRCRVGEAASAICCG
jgi:hypothetical protein